MKHLFLIKNQKSKFIYLFLLLLASFPASLFAQPEPTPSITPPPNLQPAIAGNLYTFTGSVSLPSGTSLCSYEWRVNPNQGNATLVSSSGNTADFRFNDVWGVGKIQLRVRWIGSSGSCQTPQTTGWIDYEVSIRSLRNKAPELASGGSQISVPLCNTSTIVSLKQFREYFNNKIRILIITHLRHPLLNIL